MRLKKYVFSALSLFFLGTIFAQETPPLNHGIVTLGLGYGVTTFRGDLGSEKNVSLFNNFRSGFNFSLERRVGKVLGFQFQGTFGKLSQNERSLERNLNFESKFSQFGLNVQLHMDMKSTTQFAPYFSIGAAYMLFNPTTDLKDKDGKDYYYWTDGQIRDLPEFDENNPPKKIDENKAKSVVLKKDYKYETAIANSLDSTKSGFSKSAIAIPLTFGLKFKLADFIDMRLSATYNLTMSDYLDGYKGNGDNDSYVYAQMSVNYKIGKKYVSPADAAFQSVDFASLFAEDKDGDGIPDTQDNCPNSPKGVNVDPKGCPLDDDKDGVPNYLDKEATTAVGATVNRFGVTLTDADIERLRLMRDSVYAERVSKFYEAPNMEGLQNIDQNIVNKSQAKGNISSSIPPEFRFADFNGDGILKSAEITKMIDSFFEGELDISVSTIMSVIDYFFEQ